MLNHNTEKLTSAMSSLPQLLEKKRILDAHTSIATGRVKLSKEISIELDSVSKLKQLKKISLFFLFE